MRSKSVGGLNLTLQSTPTFQFSTSFICCQYDPQVGSDGFWVPSFEFKERSFRVGENRVNGKVVMCA